MSKLVTHKHNGNLWCIQGSSCAPSLQDNTVQSWDVRVAVCAVAARNIEAHSDEVLVFLLRNAVDKQALDDLFNELFRRYQSRVTRWCSRITRNPDCVPDLVQEVFLRAFRRLCTYRGNSRFSTWLYALTRNHCLNALKKRRTEPTGAGEVMPDDFPGAHGKEVHLAMERVQSFQNMWRLIQATLTPMEVRAMALHYGHGLSLAIITRQMNLSNPSGAKAYIVNARRKLKAVLRNSEARLRTNCDGNRTCAAS